MIASVKVDSREKLARIITEAGKGWWTLGAAVALLGISFLADENSPVSYCVIGAGGIMIMAAEAIRRSLNYRR